MYQRKTTTTKPKANPYGKENKHGGDASFLGWPPFTFFMLFSAMSPHTHTYSVGRSSARTNHGLSCVLVNPLSGPRFTPVTVAVIRLDGCGFFCCPAMPQVTQPVPSRSGVCLFPIFHCYGEGCSKHPFHGAASPSQGPPFPVLTLFLSPVPSTCFFLL